MKQGKLIIISGPSGVGKKTVITKLMKILNLPLDYSISWTTRKKRKGEIEGIDYYFKTKKEFMDGIKKGKLLEYAKYEDNFYGTPLDLVQKSLKKGKHVLLEIEVIGAMQVLELKKKINLISIFLLPPTINDLIIRLKKRGTNSQESIKKRIEKANWEISQKNKYDYQVINDNVEKAALQIKKIIEK